MGNKYDDSARFIKTLNSQNTWLSDKLEKCRAQVHDVTLKYSVIQTAFRYLCEVVAQCEHCNPSKESGTTMGMRVIQHIGEEQQKAEKLIAEAANNATGN